MIKVENRFINWWEKNSSFYGAVFFDVDGCLISGRKALPGAVELIQFLRNSQFPFCLLTNDGNNSLQEKCEMMRKRGLEISTEEIISCGTALKPLAEKNGYAGRRFFAMGELGTPDFGELAGMKIVRDTQKISSCFGVIIGEGTYNWQPNINAVVNYYVLNTSRLMIVPNPDSYWPNGPDGEIGIGAGGKARFLCTILREYGIHIKPVYLGKPYNPVYSCALKHLKEKFGLPRSVSGKKILMLGDSLLSDIRGANRMGFSSGLVLTGITNVNHVKQARANCLPDFIFRTL